MKGLFASSGDFYKSLPKVELHRHLEGSLRVSTLIEIARKHSLTLPLDITRLDRLVQVQKDEPLTIQNFLAKFHTLRMFYRSPDVIRRITREAIEDAAKDNVRYMELRFTPVALSRAERFPIGDVIDWVCDSAKEASRKFGVTVRLITSVNRHEGIELAEQVAWISADYVDRGLVGIDLAGDEVNHSAQPYDALFREARQAGLKITIHAGEWGGADNVRQAIEQIRADRIGHGVRVLEDDYVVSLARELGTVFEVCITSNFQTGVVPSLPEHPLERMLVAGLKVTLNTDDPGISQIQLTDEYRLACENLGMSRGALINSILTAAHASFQPSSERTKLADRIKKQINPS